MPMVWLILMWASTALARMPGSVRDQLSVIEHMSTELHTKVSRFPAHMQLSNGSNLVARQMHPAIRSTLQHCFMWFLGALSSAPRCRWRLLMLTSQHCSVMAVTSSVGAYAPLDFVWL